MALLDSPTLLALSLLAALTFWCFKFKRTSSSKLHHPPGPPGWPLIGNIFDVGGMPHHSFHELQSKYGPVVRLKLGTVNTIVVQSAAAAAELFKKHDLAFSDRRVVDSLTSCGYHEGSLSLALNGEYWRTVRRLCSSELTVPKRVNASAQIREQSIEKMIEWIRYDASKLGEIQLDKYLFFMTHNLMGNYMLGRDVMDLKSEKGNQFFEATNQFMYWNGKPNMVDVFSFLRWLDPQGIRRNTEKHLGILLDLVAGFVKERIEEKKKKKKLSEEKDFLDALLEYEGNEKEAFKKLSEKNITILIMEMFFAGTETTGSTIQWAMSELLHNPNSMRKLQQELDQVVGLSRKVEESDLNDLPYLQAVVKETMRLRPSLPFLLPRSAKEDTEYMGYTIPKDTMVILNAWAIHRDPSAWDDPYMFKPERFFNSNIDNKGQHFELIPFGSGRRSCIGMLLRDKVVSLTIARLVQSFDWEFGVNESHETMDMREMMGISLRKLVPLKVFPKERTSQCQLY